MTTLLPRIWSWAALKNLEPAILEAHREHLLYRARIIAWTAFVVMPVTVIPYFYLVNPGVFRTAMFVLLVAELACLIVERITVRGIFYRLYHLPGFIVGGIITNIAETCFYYLSGGHEGFFFFPYFLITLGAGVLLIGKLIWFVVITASLCSSYLIVEQLRGVALSSPRLISNVIYLLDIGIISAFANQVILALFLRDKRNQLKLEAEKEKLLKVSAQVAHDIRSPLTSLNAVVQHWKERLPEDDFFTLLDLSAKRLHSIANEVLDQHGPKKKSSFSLHRVLDELVGEYQSGNRHALTFQKEYGEALSLVGNRDRIQRAFSNVLKNAVEAMSGHGKITIRTTQEDGRAVVSISDTGSGIPPDKLQKVLRGGFTEGKADGHGIGMAVVREAVEEHGGILSAESRPGHGTTFRIKLPLPDSAALKELAEPQEGEGVFELAVSSGEPVVVIDDDPSAQLQWELTLRRLNLQPLTYESYEQFSNSPRPPLSLRGGVRTAIVDYHFDNSELDGFQIVEKLKAEGYRNIILCTGEYWKPVIRQKAQEMGVPVCPKPIPKVVVTPPAPS